MPVQQLHAFRIRFKRSAAALAVTGAMCAGGIALAAAPAGASPAAISSVTASFLARRDDGLAAIATQALSDLQSYMRTGDAATLRRYTASRNGIADQVAARLTMDSIAMRAAWDAADLPHQVALMAAFTQLGVPYRRNTSKAGVGFDCSGLTTYAWGVAGVTLFRQSGVQIRRATPRTVDTAMAGDLVYYPGHVMLYLGVDGAIVHAPYSGVDVQVDTLPMHHSVRFGDPTN